MEKFTSKRRSKPTDICQYGASCYRKNPHHFMEYRHEHLEKIIEQNTTNRLEQYVIPDTMTTQKLVILDQIKVINELFPPETKEEPSAKKNKSDEQNNATQKTSTPLGHDNNRPNSQRTTNMNSASTTSSSASTSTSTSASTPHKDFTPRVDIHKYIKVVAPKGKMAEKLKASHPFNFFLTCISSSPPTHNEPLSITFQEILDKSLGELECSVQINFMVDIGWLLGQYYFAGYLSIPMLVLYGSAATPEIETISQKKPQITAQFVQMTPFATHHTKMMLLGYKDGSMRVVVSTANLYEDDWHNRTQGTRFTSNKIFNNLHVSILYRY